jgi:hypothetical protein
VGKSGLKSWIMSIIHDLALKTLGDSMIGSAALEENCHRDVSTSRGGQYNTGRQPCQCSIAGRRDCLLSMATVEDLLALAAREYQP